MSRFAVLFATAAISANALGQELPTSIRSLHSLSAFTTNYYRDPHPELVTSSIVFLRDVSPPNRDQVAPIVGFYAEVFSSNPERLPAWKAEVEKATGEAAKAFHAALTDSTDLSVLTGFDPVQANPSLNDLCWGAYFASGKLVYVNAIIHRLAFLSERKSLLLYLTATSAQWSLCSNAQQHPTVRKAIEAALVGASPTTRAALGDTLSKTPAQLRESSIAVLRAQKAAGIW